MKKHKNYFHLFTLFFPVIFIHTWSFVDRTNRHRSIWYGFRTLNEYCDACMTTYVSVVLDRNNKFQKRVKKLCSKQRSKVIIFFCAKTERRRNEYRLRLFNTSLVCNVIFSTTIVIYVPCSVKWCVAKLRVFKSFQVPCRRSFRTRR